MTHYVITYVTDPVTPIQDQHQQRMLIVASSIQIALRTFAELTAPTELPIVAVNTILDFVGVYIAD